MAPVPVALVALVASAIATVICRRNGMCGKGVETSAAVRREAEVLAQNSEVVAAATALVQKNGGNAPPSKEIAEAASRVASSLNSAAGAPVAASAGGAAGGGAEALSGLNRIKAELRPVPNPNIKRQEKLLELWRQQMGGRRTRKHRSRRNKKRRQTRR